MFVFDDRRTHGQRAGFCATPTFWGTAEIGIPRSEVAAQYGNQYLNSGFKLVMSGLPPGVQHYVKVYARNATNLGIGAVQLLPEAIKLFGFNAVIGVASIELGVVAGSAGYAAWWHPCVS